MIPTSEFVPGKLSCLRVCSSLLGLTLTGLLLPVTAQAQVTYTGAAATQNLGSQAIGSPSAATTLSFSVAAGTTVGSIAVVTQGTPNLDFTSATGGTCTATTYASASACTVNVTFTPKAAGGRSGAVVFFSEAGNAGTVLGLAPVYGVGTGPQIAYGPSPAVYVNVGVTDPFGLAVDAAGDLFIADNNVDDRVDEVPAGGGAAIATYPTVNGSGLNGPTGITVDGAGDLFVVDSNNERVVKVAIGGVATAISPTVDGKALSFAGGCGYGGGGVAVDGAGNLFIADTDNNRILEVPADGGAPIAVDITVNGNGVYGPCRLAIDGAGNLFIADITHVVKAPAGGGPATAIYAEVNGSPLSAVYAVALDGAGDLFIGDSGRVVEVPAGGGAAIALDPILDTFGLEEVEGVAVDGLGNLFMSSFFHSEVLEVPRSQPPLLNFPTVTAVGSTDSTDGTKTAQIVNIGNEALTLTALSYPADFSEASEDANACTGSTSLSPGHECDVPIEFTPLNAGMLSESVTLTDNALNGTGAQQSITVTGTSPVALTSPVPGSTLGVSNITFTWTAGTEVTSCTLWLGTAGPGSSDLYASGITTATSVIVPSLPAHGATVYARLYYEIAGMEYHLDAAYTEGTMGLAALISPTAGSTLGVSNLKFTWSAGTYVTEYVLWLGLNGPGSSSLYSSGPITALTTTVASLPADGAKIYARLFSVGSGGEQYIDYTYTEPSGTSAVLTSPTPGSTLGTSNVTFTWTAGTDVTTYGLLVGVSGPGSTDLFYTGSTAATTAAVPDLPAHGATIYVRLMSDISGAWQYNDYTYTEQ